jgi:hypothetical protein
MMPSQKQAEVNLVLRGSAVITGAPIEDQNIETMTFGIDLIVLGRDCGIPPSGSHIPSTPSGEKNHDSSAVKT